MVISHKYKFIFIKTKKTAGTSIEVFLSQCCAKNDILTRINPHIEPHVARNYKGDWNPLREIIALRGCGWKSATKKVRKQRRKQKKFYNHIPARTVKNRIPNRWWKNYLKFCVERNPWDKTLSHYNMINDRAGGNLTLDQYFKAGDFCLNYPLYTDANGNVIVDRVIKYEFLMDELKTVFGMLGIVFNGTLGVNAKSDHRTDRIPYQEVFTAEHKTIIERVFAKEIEMHGYRY
jgi:hypothetical protein